MTETAIRIAAGVQAQPISAVQWLPRETLTANTWNPNKQAPPELRLLKLSILENGWTQPIVARDQADGTFEIVDGFHRWKVSDSEELRELTGGLVPVVVLPPTDEATAMAATVRHNRARGTHHVLGMSDIVRRLIDDEGLPPEEVARRFGMDEEEVERLADHAGMPTRGAHSAFNSGWTV